RMRTSKACVSRFIGKPTAGGQEGDAEGYDDRDAVSGRDLSVAGSEGVSEDGPSVARRKDRPLVPAIVFYLPTSRLRKRRSDDDVVQARADGSGHRPQPWGRPSVWRRCGAATASRTRPRPRFHGAESHGL